MLYSVELSDYMLKFPVTISQDSSVSEAIKIITENKISGVLVVNEQREVLGALSELDCLRIALKDFNNNEEIGTAIIGDVMTKDIERQHPHDDIVDVAESMLDHKRRRRPVVLDDKLIGLVTCRQILKVFGEQGLKER